MYNLKVWVKDELDNVPFKTKSFFIKQQIAIQFCFDNWRTIKKLLRFYCELQATIILIIIDGIFFPMVIFSYLMT